MKKYITSQFGFPRGFLGNVVGFIMALENRERNKWAVEIMNIRENERVLEIGFGPGVALAEIAKKVKDGFIAGIDPSDVMLKQGSISSLPFQSNTFNKMLLVNSLHHCPNPEENLKQVKHVLKPQGQLFVVEQPHTKNKQSEESIKNKAQKLNQLIQATGFITENVYTYELKNGMVFSVAARKEGN